MSPRSPLLSELEPRSAAKASNPRGVGLEHSFSTWHICDSRCAGPPATACKRRSAAGALSERVVAFRETVCPDVVIFPLQRLEVHE